MMLTEAEKSKLINILDGLLSPPAFLGEIDPMETEVVSWAHQSAESSLNLQVGKIRRTMPENIDVPYDHVIMRSKSPHLAWCSFGILKEIDLCAPDALLVEELNLTPNMHVFIALHIITSGKEFEEADSSFIKTGLNAANYECSYLHILADNYNKDAIQRCNRISGNYTIDDELRYNANLRKVDAERCYPVYWRPITPQP